jgi:hypothetical protein
MADGAGKLSGRIKPQDADQVLIAALVSIACRMSDSTETDVALHLIGRALPMAGASTRMQGLKPHAVAVLAAGPNRRKPGDAGAVDWCRAMIALQRAMAADALHAALSRVEH